MADINDDVFFATIVELNAGLRQKQFSAAELARAFSDRLERLGPHYNALALSLRDSALRKARQVDDDIKRGRWRGLLQGIPFAVKDLLAVAGQPTTWGAKPYAAQVFDYNATVVNRLDRTGAVLTGKLSMIELAGGPSYRYARASLQGPCLNPWDRTRWAGGSSSGSGAAVAAGLVPFALGSETSGSILTPSAFCGVTGLRPTYGLVSRHGAMALSWTMDKIGPMCRSAEDCGIVLEAIAGKDANDPASAGKSFYYAPQYARPVKDIVVGFAPVDFAEWPESSARPSLQTAFEQIKSLGVRLKEVRLPDLPYGALTSTIIAAEGSSVFEPLIQSGKVEELADPLQIAGLKAGLEIPASEYLKAMRIRSLVQAGFRELFAGVDVLLTPSRLTAAPKISQPLDRPRANAAPPPKDRGLTALIPAGNLAGIPALSLPCGFADGLPVAISLVGRPFSENLLLSVGREYQVRTDWHRRRPPAAS
ncbi:MAG TPA: amidase [Bryobacteraceae bacterium]|nr:amidase [Bryobacteraceae bacterium]